MSSINGTNNSDVIYVVNDDPLHSNGASGGGGDDFIMGSSGQDYLNGGDGDDYLVGGGDRDTLDGGNGNDTLRGGDGHDQLVNSPGNDAFYGENGPDLFTFYNYGDNDTIYDFGQGADFLQVELEQRAGDSYSIQQIGNNTLITYSDVSSNKIGYINLVGVNASDLDVAEHGSFIAIT